MYYIIYCKSNLDLLSFLLLLSPCSKDRLVLVVGCFFGHTRQLNPPDCMLDFDSHRKNLPKSALGARLPKTTVEMK